MKKVAFQKIAAFATFAVCAFAVIGCAEDKGATVSPDAGKAQAQASGMYVSESEESGVSMISAQLLSAEFDEYGVSPLADTACTLTATVSPTYTTNPVVEWTISWVNASSEWATGKNVSDYVTIATSGDYFQTAVVSCNQAFGEQIKIRATAASNAAAYAECTVDYAERIVGGSITLGNPLSPDFLCLFTASEATINDSHGDDNLCTVAPSASAHTVTDTFTSSCTFTFSSEFIAAVGAKSNSLQSGKNYSFSKTTWDLTSEKMPCSVGNMAWQLDATGVNAMYLTSFYSMAQSDIYAIIQAQPDMVLGYIDVSYTGTYSSFSNTIAVKAGANVVEQAASSVSLDTTSWIF